MDEKPLDVYCRVKPGWSFRSIDGSTVTFNRNDERFSVTIMLSWFLVERLYFSNCVSHVVKSTNTWFQQGNYCLEENYIVYKDNAVHYTCDESWEA